ncbi:LamG domain-containing protein [bacterium]|nr:LamG domain-containing protein [bacterium]
MLKFLKQTGSISLFILIMVLNNMCIGAEKEKGLVAYWNFDEGKGSIAKDSSSNRNNGEIYGAKYVKVQEGYALEFDGVNNYVNCGNDPSLKFTGSFSIALWEKHDSAAQWQTLVSNQGANIYGHGLDIQQGVNYNFLICGLTPMSLYVNGVTEPDNKLRYVVVVYDAVKSEKKVYVDGVEKSTRSVTGAPIESKINFFIGSYQGQSQWFNGIIDEVKIYNRALSEEEIKANCGKLITKTTTVKRIPIRTGEIIQSGNVSVQVAEFGGVQINNNKSFCVLESSFSYPASKIGTNTFSVKIDGVEKDWKPQVKKINDTTIAIEASGEHYSVKRNILLKKERIEIEDTFTNLKNVPVGILISHNYIAPEILKNTRAMTTAANPIIFFSQSGGDFGILAEDNVSRLQFNTFCDLNTASLRHSSFALDSGKSYTFRYAVYPLEPTGDVSNFINRVRRDWNANFTIEGPFSFIDVPTHILKDLPALHTLKKDIKRRKLKIIALMPWLDYDPGAAMDHVISRDEYKVMMQNAAKILHEIDPEIKVVGCIETDWVTIYPEKIKNGEVIYNGTPEQFTKVIDEASLSWKDSAKRDSDGKLALERYTRGGKPQLALAVYPALGNYQHKFLMDQIRFLIEDVGLDGIYIDEFNQAWSGGSIRSYEGWDGISVDIDSETGKIINKYINCSLAGIKSRVEIINSVLARGKIFIANTYATSKEEQSLPAQRFWEMQDFLNISFLNPGEKPPFVYEMCEGVLGSPIGLGVTRSPKKPHLAQGLMLGMMSYLRHGLLYYHYRYGILPEEGIGSGEYGPINHMFPLTPVALHEGWIEGKERIITAISGTYYWYNEKKPNIFLFDINGRERGNSFEVIKDKKGWQVKVNLKDWEEIAVIEE